MWHCMLVLGQLEQVQENDGKYKSSTDAFIVNIDDESPNVQLWDLRGLKDH